jgi:hypothetical protein
MEDVGIFYGRLVYSTAIWYILWPFGILFGYLVHFSRFGMLYREKSGNPGPELSPATNCSGFFPPLFWIVAIFRKCLQRVLHCKT